MSEQLIGTVTHYFGKAQVAGIEVTEGELHVGDTIHVIGHTSDFTQQPQVINGFSELMVDVFGEKAGKAARSAVGMASLPGNIAVEIEAIFQVRA